MIDTVNLQPVTLGVVEFLTNSGPAKIPIKTGDAFMVAGPNGAGKSALLYTIYRSVGAGRAEYYPGHRQITFNNGWDNLAQDINQLRTNMFTHVDVFNRYKNQWAEDLFKSVVRRLANTDAAYNAELVRLLGNNPDEAQAEHKAQPGPVETLNRVFQAARMAVRFKSSGRGLRVVRENNEYDIDQLSDGERAALFVAGAVIVQDPYTVIAIDEPERNLHPSIAAPLVNSLITARPDVAFLFASHDVNLISGTNVDRILYVKNSSVISTRPETRSFDVEILSELENIDESIRLDLLGSRQKLLFVEGTTNSIDFKIYNCLFPDWKITPKGGAQDVIDAVKSLRRNQQLHWVEAAGLIDRDGRTESEVQTLESEGIYALRCPTSENLLFLEKVSETVATILFQSEGGLEVQARLAAAQSAAQEALNIATPEISARLAAWRINRELAEAKVSVSQIRESETIKESFDFSSIIENTNDEISNIAASSVGIDGIRGIPIKNTIIGSRISAALGCDLKRYQKIVFRQLEINNDLGESIKFEMLKYIPTF
ncbi:AAA family ATPase [Erythrobacter sp. BLCC-B19]|uniref:AAA family ATPase n=1 Tax=Erythrobacter sp. BLCC-B19 TaxID=3025315 RepID=UPI00235F432E|nr:AAA family ATPase [Erythrobacter sp. BLCC-B19]WDA40337.1 AAA family ATPase [Erythrobacter sp. BLCC-B19]